MNTNANADAKSSAQNARAKLRQQVSDNLPALVGELLCWDESAVLKGSYLREAGELAREFTPGPHAMAVVRSMVEQEACRQVIAGMAGSLSPVQRRVMSEMYAEDGETPRVECHREEYRTLKVLASKALVRELPDELRPDQQHFDIVVTELGMQVARVLQAEAAHLPAAT